MNITAVQDELAEKLRTIAGLNITPYQADSISPPAVMFDVPDRYVYDHTHGRGSDRLTLPILVLVGRASARGARLKLNSYVAGDGPGSVKSALDSTNTNIYTTCHTVTVTEVDMDTFSVASVVYLGAEFKVDIFGPGRTT